MKKKITALLLALALTVGMGTETTQLYAGAQAGQRVWHETETYVNPYYEGVISEEDLAGETGTLKAARSAAGYETDPEVVAEQIREHLIDRETSFQINYQSPEGYDNTWLNSWWELAMAETEDSHGGDYLQWSYGGYKANISYSYTGSVYQYEYTLDVTYYTTAAQEEELDAKLDEVMEELGVEDDSLSDYEKTERIYDYICKTVTYDYTNLNNDAYLLKYTAYAALINKTAVCQGYSTLMYRMLEDAGVDTRVIVGQANGGNHAWNISKLGARYYLSDSTWDAEGTGYSYYLKGTKNFPDHTSESEFLAGYPVSSTDYSVTGITLNKTSLALNVDGSEVLSVSIQPETAAVGETAEWSSSDPEIAAVDENGNVTGVGSGTAVITVKAGGRIAECTVTVSGCDHNFVWITDRAATDSETGIKHEECTECGKTRNEGTVIDMLSHIHELELVPEHEATCTQEGNIEYYRCKTCGKLYEDEDGLTELKQEDIILEKTSHTYGTEWVTDEDFHWHECVCGAKDDKASHTMQWIIDRKATTEEDGVKHEECAECGYRRSEGTVIDKLTHEHDMEYVEEQEADCTQEGNTDYYRCKICGKLYEDEDGQTELTQEDIVLEKTPHSYGAEWVTDETTHWHECVCGAKSGMAEHRWVQTELTAATTEEDGAAVSTCSVCKEDYEEIIPQIDGVWLSEDSYTYNGKVRIPEIYVEDIEGDEIDPAYYTIIYPTGCKNVGEYTVTVQFKGAYSGTLRETYQILPKGTTLRKLTAGSRSITVTWKKQKKQTSGYEIAYSQKKNFKGAKKVKVSGKYTSKTLTRLKTGKKYYVKIRTYRTVKINGRSKKLYSGWSKAKSVRVK